MAWLLALVFAVTHDAVWGATAAPPAGYVVWWGFNGHVHPDPHRTNGLVFRHEQPISNAVALVASPNSGQAAALLSDGTVYRWGAFVGDDADVTSPSRFKLVDLVHGVVLGGSTPGGQFVALDRMMRGDWPTSAGLKRVRKTLWAGRTLAIVQADGAVKALLFKSPHPDAIPSLKRQTFLASFPLKSNGRPLKEVGDAVNWQEGLLYVTTAGDVMYMPSNVTFDYAVDPVKEDRLWVTPIPATNQATGTALRFFEFPGAEPFKIDGVEVRGVKALAASTSHALALKRDGSVLAWGAQSADETEVPPGLAQVTAVAARPGYSMALLDDGQVIAWGGRRLNMGAGPVPAGLGNVSQIAVSQLTSFALTTNQAVARQFMTNKH